MGVAREVTGSCYLIETGSVRFLVDCGMAGKLAAKTVVLWILILAILILCC